MSHDLAYQAIFNVIDESILPSLSMVSANCCLAEEIWKLIRHLPYDHRSVFSSSSLSQAVGAAHSAMQLLLFIPRCRMIWVYSRFSCAIQCHWLSALVYMLIKTLGADQHQSNVCWLMQDRTMSPETSFLWLLLVCCANQNCIWCFVAGLPYNAASHVKSRKASLVLTTYWLNPLGRTRSTTVSILGIILFSTYKKKHKSSLDGKSAAVA